MAPGIYVCNGRQQHHARYVAGGEQRRLAAAAADTRQRGQRRSYIREDARRVALLLYAESPRERRLPPYAIVGMSAMSYGAA